jgi:LmbE family N-acetylglucosaminyl deacetylase
MEISCGGTLLKCLKRGDNVTVCHVANGDMGHVVIMPEELRLIRAAEAQNAGKLGGLKIVTCDIGDLRVNGSDRAQIDTLVKIIRDANPDLIITHAPNDYMCDHVEVSKLVQNASFSASCPHYEMDLGPACKVTPLYYMDNLAGMSFNPTEYVDITDEIELKLQMLECHESQIKWMLHHDKIDFVDFVRTCSKFRGLQCGVPYAEAFTQAYVWPKVTTKRLLP